MSTISLPRRRRWLSTVIVGVLVAIFLFTILAGFIVEILWYDEIQQSPVFWHTLSTKIWLGVVFGVLFFALLYVNLVIARRIRPEETIIPNPLDPLERIRDATEPDLRWLLPLGAAALAFLVGLSVSGNWQLFLLWRNASGVFFGNPDPQFHRDPAFYVFSLPWLRFLQGWLFSSLIGVTFLVAIGHVLWGGIRPQAPAFADKVTPAARAHLSVLLGLVMLVKAWGYWVGGVGLVYSAGRVVRGGGLLARAVRPALLAARCRRRRELHRGEGAAAGAELPGARRRDLRGPVLREHPDQAVEPADRRGRVAGDRFCPARNRVSLVRAAVQGEAERAAARGAVHRGQHRIDVGGVRTQSDPATASPHRCAAAVGRAVEGQPHDGVEHPTVASVDVAEELRRLPADPSVLQLPRRRRVSVSDRSGRQLARDHGLGARAQPGWDPIQRTDLAEHASDLHAWLWRDRLAGEHRDRAGSARPDAEEPAP